MEKLVCKLGSRQLEGQSDIESLKVTDGRIALEYPGRESSMECSASCECSTARHAGFEVELDQVPAVLRNDEGAICTQEMVKPG